MLRVLYRGSSQITKVAQCKFFWKKKEVINEQSQNNKTNEWQGKEKFLNELRQKREEYEKLKTRAQQENYTQDLRLKREHEVNYGSVDYAKVLAQNINLTMTEAFRHPEELFNFISGIRVKLTEQNLVSCLQGFILFAEQLNEQDIQRREFQEFLAIVASSVRIISKEEHLICLFQFLDLYCIESDHPIWEKCEIALMSKIGNLKLETINQILHNMSNQKEGSELLWDNCEKHIQGKIEIIQNPLQQISFVVEILVSYWKVRKGTTKFVELLVSYINQALEQKNIISSLSIKKLISIAQIYSQLAESLAAKQKYPTTPEKQKQSFKLLEESLKEKINQMEFQELCLTAQSFGFHYGTEKFFKTLEIKVQQNFDKLSIQELRQIISGFLLTYRGSKGLFQICQDRILAAQHEFTVSEFCEIVKAYHITENEDPQFLLKIEKLGRLYKKFQLFTVVQRLKEVKDVTIQEIYDIARSYLITRIGSRELYRLLEIVVKFRLVDIRKDAQILQGLHNLFVTSGLCTPKLIESLEILQ